MFAYMYTMSSGQVVLISIFIASNILCIGNIQKSFQLFLNAQ